MQTKKLAGWGGGGAAGALGGSAANADVKVSPLFSDHMVLQQGIDAPVWGTADAGEEVTVTVGEAKASAKAGDDGKWMVKLSKLPVSDSTTMMINGKNE